MTATHPPRFSPAIVRLLACLVATHSAFAQSQWQSVPTPNAPCTARHEASLTALNGKLYLLGGRGIKPVEEFDPATKAWRKLAPTPIEFHHFQALAINGRIAVVGALTGGYPKEQPVPNVWWFDPAGNQWTSGPAMPAGRLRGSAGVVFHKGKVYLVCGNTNGHWNGFVPWVDVLDLKTGQWRPLPDAPRPRDHFQAALAAGKIVAAAGRRSYAEKKQTFDLTIAEVDVFDLKRDRWSTLAAPIPTPRAGGMAITRDGRILVLGGESVAQPEAHRQMEALHLATGKWETLAPLLEGRHGTGVGFIGNDLYVAAGCARRGGNPEINSVEKLAWRRR